MIIFDKLGRLADNGELIIPTFQAGHLGFIPGRSVHAYLLKENESPPAYCEVAITPIDTANQSDLLRLVCVMHESPEALGKLLKALALLNVNVVALESSTVHHQKYHYITMVINIATSKFLSLQNDKADDIERFYLKESAIVPLHQKRYGELFETIIAYCGDVMAYTSRGLPRITIRTFDIEEKNISNRQPVFVESSVAVERETANGVVVRLKEDLLATIRSNTRTPKDQRLGYFLVSETEYRRLRIVFTNYNQTCSAIHIAFIHKDSPGTLNAIVNILTVKGFQILSSLHVSFNAATSVFETILWYRGDKFPKNKFPKLGTYNEQLEWVASMMTTQLESHYLADIVYRDIRICSNVHRQFTSLDVESSISLSDLITSSPKSKLYRAQSENQKWDERTSSILSILDKSINTLRTTENESSRSAITMLGRVKKRRTAKPRIFISCSADKDVTQFVESIENTINKEFPGMFKIDTFRNEASTFIVKTVRKKIYACSAFVGIWHHDPTIPIQNKPGTFGTSPWMLYEFGQAIALGKPRFMVRERSVDSRFCKSVDPDYIMISYTTIDDFNAKVPRHLIKWCRGMIANKYI